MSLSNNISERINVSRLPSPPNVAVQILKLAGDPNASLIDMATVLESDPALAAQILRVCNSAAYYRGQEVTSLRQAASTLGTKSISIIALSFSLKTAIENWTHESGLSDEDLWKHSVATAVTSRSLARLLRLKEVEGAFLCGLLSRIGQLLLYSVMPDDYGRVLAAAEGKIPTCELEEAELGITHQQAGGFLLAQWGLPDLFPDVVRTWGTNDPEVSDETKTYGTVVAVGDAVAEMLFNGDKAKSLTCIYDLSEKQLGLSGGEVDRMVRASTEDIAQTLSLFEISCDRLPDCDKILEQARQQLVDFNLSLVADLNKARDDQSTLVQENAVLAKASSSDALTGLFNRAALDQELAAVDKARQNAGPSIPYSIIMVDLDGFKAINDTYGHTAGDEVLKSVSEALFQCARATDFVARYGGEEFAVVLTNAGKAEAANVAHRFRACIEQRTIELKDRTLQVTASVGVASSDSFPPHAGYLRVLEAADKALYVAKTSGKNQVVSHDFICESQPT